ncbi:MFS transporter [Amycolatopsis sp. CA-161197]|uniref:MFS transporter n=1 Tax=Amycolatopsis sp. CA-161197 TaxID=3239922 RepID=UPI003D92063A
MARHILQRHADFRRLFLGNSVSLLGSSVTTVALPLAAVLTLHASSIYMGLLGAAALLPHFLLGLPAGVWVDRLPYRQILVTADIAQLVLISSIPVAAAFGMPTLAQLLLVALLAGVANLFETVAAQSFTPALVPPEELLPANSALMLSTTTVATTGSALGGALVALLTAPFAIVADAASFLVAALLKARIRVPGPPRAAREHHLVKDVLEGLHAVFGHPVLRVVTLSATLGAFAGQLQNTVLVLYLVRELGFSPAAVGLTVTVAGAAGMLGALVAHPITRRLGPGRAYLAGMTLASAAGLVIAAGGAIAAVAGQVLRGAGPSLYGVNQQTLRQTLIAPDLLSRATATWRFLVYGMQPLGALAGGLLGSVSLRATLITGAAVMALATVSAVRLSRVREL